MSYFLFQNLNQNPRTLLPKFYGLYCYQVSKLSIISDVRLNRYLSYDVASVSEIMPFNKIDKPLVVYRFTGNVMMSIIRCAHYFKI